MAREFMDDNFLLPTRAAERLYHDYAKDMPIYDYHSHLPARQIAQDARFGKITQVWLYGDHYKWRVPAGIASTVKTGETS